MSLSIDDLVSEMTAQELWSLLFTIADGVGLPITAMQEIEAPRSLITTFSSWAASLWNSIIRRAIQAQYGDFVVDAGRTWATFWGLSLYGVPPEEATFAEGACLLTNTKGGNWSFAPGTFQVSNSLTGKKFVNTQQVTLPPWPGFGLFPTQTVNFRAVEPGSESTSAAGNIDTVVTAANGVTVSNPGTISGQDEEPLIDFVLRARGTPALLSPNGPKAAFETILRRSLRSDGTRIPVNRVRVRQPTGNGVIRAVVAGPSGALSTEDVARLLLSVQSLAEPWCATAQVVSATSVLVPYNVTAYAKQSPTLTSEQVEADAVSALTSFIAGAPIGGFNKAGGDSGFIYVAELGAVVSESNGAVFAADPIGDDVVIAAEEVPLLGTGSITVSIIA